ncbi:serine/threonine-protein kinase Sgk2 [Blastomyces dermatitidis ER-3]|uniref:non-specific serine/threonine protein kinase n=1 Tax=Ajellomyces dermatitidis (strain ER-3 / ATCC MYA-2586) TaxID=559297 RepID=A0ABM9YID5_AJEDR|nr:serine/threonine-protein kinase Sgk2 [Blastomyces dermatitidis ER-3]EEQ91416.2 serine/threonine-protein kinase Sgk2 [Blastomyces dermatitidis ER-3]
MTRLSQEDCNIIKNHPLSDLVDRLQGALQEAERIYESRLISHHGAVDSLDQLYQSVFSKLVYTLLGEAAAYSLCSRISDGNVASDLAHIFKCLQKTKGNFRYNDYQPLMHLVIQRPPTESQNVETWNFNVWKAVFTLIDTIPRQTTPPASVPPSFDSTPVKSTSTSQRGSEQTCDLVNPRIFEEIHDCTFRDVGGFFDKYFEGKDWSSKADAICQRVLAPDTDGNWAQFPDPPTQSNVLTWWFRLQEDLLLESRSMYYTTASKADLTGSKAERQADLLLRTRDESPLRPRDESLLRNNHNWADILVVGELKKSKEEIKTKGTLLQMSRYVREVFAAQPTRRFIHAFAVCGTEMEVWVFDRSGPYSSGIIDVYTDSRQFFQVLVGYTMMSDEELGLDTFIARDEDGNKSITVKGPGNSEERKMQLGDMLSFQRAIVCRGTTCFLANDGQAEGVAKFSWVSDKRRPEAELLELASQKNVRGVATIIGYGAITSIADMRCGLTFDNKRHNFKSAPPSTTSLLHHSQPLTWPGYLDIHRKTSSRKRRSPDKGLQTSKRSRNTQQESELSFSIQSVHQPSLFDRNSEELYDNRILRCLVISPAGRPIYDYRSPLELLTALCDAIKAHQSLYLDGNILHRDISENNIIITDPGKADGHSGMLIDLDLAKEVGSGRSGARHQTGTMEFMAIEVLLNIDHTYRHDLESFFYVLIWQCAHHGWYKLNQLRVLYQRHGGLRNRMLEIWCAGSHETIANTKQDDIGTGGFEHLFTVEYSPPNNSLLTKWYTDTYREIARIKRGDMGADGFEDILSEFPPILECVKPLCRAIRDILFPYGGRGIIIGTPQDPKCLYNPIIKAYDDAISLIGGCHSD